MLVRRDDAPHARLVAGKRSDAAALSRGPEGRPPQLDAVVRVRVRVRVRGLGLGSG